MSKKRVLLIVFELIIIIFLVKNFGFAYVSGNSMEPNLSSGDLVFYSKLSHYSEGSIIIFNSDSFDKLLIKRIHSIDIKSGRYFVLGDNKEASEDSRNPLIGTIDEKDVVGKVIVRILPFKKSGSIGG